MHVMTYVLPSLLAASLVVVMIVAFRQQAKLLERHASVVSMLISARERETEAWAAERRELLNRVQRPDVLPAAPVVEWTAPEHEPDEIDLVGTIRETSDQ